MLFYLSIIIIATFLFSCCEKNYKCHNKIYFIFFFLFIMLLSLLGGLRDKTIGTDISGYGMLYFEQALYTKRLSSLLKYVKGEYAYHTLNWLCAKVSDKINFMFFVSEFTKIVLVSSTALYFRNKINATLFMFAYLCFFYFTGFNIMRQILAIAVFIYSLRYWYEQKHIKYILTCILAMLFHSSAFMALFIYPISWFAKYGVRKCFVINIIILSFVYIGSMMIMEYIQILDIGLYSEKALLYVEKEGAITAKTNILIAIIFLLISTIYFKKKQNIAANKDYAIFVSLAIWNLFFLFMSPYFEVAFRLSWYQVPIMLIIYLEYAKQNNKYHKSYMLNSVFIVLFLVHYIVAANHGLGDTIPYTSEILGIK